MTEDKQTTLVSKMSAHNTSQLKAFFEGSRIEGDWQLIFASAYSGCTVSLPAKGGGQMQLRIAARYSEKQPFLELRARSPGDNEDQDVSDGEQAALADRMSAHNTAQLKAFFDGADIESDWQLIFASSYNGCIISLPANGGGQMRLRIAAKYRDEYPYVELRAQRMGGDEEK